MYQLYNNEKKNNDHVLSYNNQLYKWKISYI